VAATFAISCRTALTKLLRGRLIFEPRRCHRPRFEGYISPEVTVTPAGFALVGSLSLSGEIAA
jgi:hypothetical protein